MAAEATEGSDYEGSAYERRLVPNRLKQNRPVNRPVASSARMNVTERTSTSGSTPARRSGLPPRAPPCIIHFSIQSNHLHFIVEALGKVTLAKGLRGLAIWLVRRINKEFGRHGQVFEERYHARPLETLTEVRNAIVHYLPTHDPRQ
jgi:hypothetical protein